MWAGITVAMVMELGAGASFRASLLRLQGSVIGAFFGLAAIFVAQKLDAAVGGGTDAGAGREVLRHSVLLTLFVAFSTGCGFVRASAPKVAYASLVAQFTAAIVLMAPRCGGLAARCEEDGAAMGATFSFDRIQYTLLGLMAVVLASIFVFPVDSRASARHALADASLGLRMLWAQSHEHWLAASLLGPEGRSHGRGLGSDKVTPADLHPGDVELAPSDIELAVRTATPRDAESTPRDDSAGHSLGGAEEPPRKAPPSALTDRASSSELAQAREAPTPLPTPSPRVKYRWGPRQRT